MAKILKGTKKAFRNWEVIQVRVPYKNKITMKLVFKKIAGVDSIIKYLPDDPITHCNRDYLYTIVNTFDPQFFMSCIDGVERHRLKNRASKEEQVVEMDPQMLKVMERLSDFNIGHQNPRSLAMMKIDSKKKRKWADVQCDFEIDTMISANIARRELCNSIIG